MHWITRAAATAATTLALALSEQSASPRPTLLPLPPRRPPFRQRPRTTTLSMTV